LRITAVTSSSRCAGLVLPKGRREPAVRVSRLVHASRAKTVHVERHKSEPCGVDTLRDLVAPRERALEFGGLDLDARHRAVVTDAALAEAERAQRLLGLSDRGQLVRRDGLSVRDARRQAGLLRRVPGAEAQLAGQPPVSASASRRPVLQ
jgi:hypothetical protein